MNRVKTGCCYILVIVLMLNIMTGLGITKTVEVQAADKTITLAQAISLALNNSDDYRKVKSKISLQEIKYTQAVKSVELKKKNMTTFRWSPLLSFHFPESTSLSDEFEWTNKPFVAQSELQKLKHQLTDVNYSVREKVSNLYVQTYTAQYTVQYQQKYIEQLNTSLEKNKARLYVSTAKQSDIDMLEKYITSANTALGNATRKFEALKKQLSDMISLDVTSGYSFKEPYVKGEIDRSQLESIAQYTLDNSHTYYTAKVDTQVALAALNTNYSLMQSHYGSDMSYISQYISNIKSGKKVDTDAFKSAYDQFLNKVDSYWTGRKRILFIKIPKEWFKGEMDGIRYVEDDPYILYTNALEYTDALNEQNLTEKDIRSEVENGFENLVVVRNSYTSLSEQVKQLEQELETAMILNKLGELEYKEYKETEDLYREAQLNELEALDMYTQTLFSYDRLTCGAITKLLAGEDISISAVSGGESFTDAEAKENITYTITTKFEDSVFELNVNVPDDYEPEVTSYELWVNNTQVGERTEAGGTIRHLALVLDSIQETFIRLYNGDTFVADCSIDPSQYKGILKLDNGSNSSLGESSEETQVIRQVASYSFLTNRITGMSEITIKANPIENIRYYRIINIDGKALYSDNYISINDTFNYFSFAVKDLEQLRIEFYDNNENLLYTGDFETKDMTITVKE